MAVIDAPFIAKARHCRRVGIFGESNGATAIGAVRFTVERESRIGFVARSAYDRDVESW